MRKVISFLFLVSLILVLILFNYRPRPIQLSHNLYKSAESVKEGELIVQFLGNTNLLFSDGKNSILTDGFFSRPSALKILFGKVAPDKNSIAKCLQKANIESLDAVIPLHSHFDHAMDAPAVAKMTGAKLIGSSSTANIGRGFGLKEEQIKIPELGSTLTIGKFKITFIKSNHWQYPDAKQRKLLLNNRIEEPLISPASIFDYKEGDSYTLLIQHDSIKIAIQGSAGYLKNSLPNFDADILFLSIGGLDVMDETYNQAYQDYLIAPLQAEFLVPIHWDDFTVKLSDKPLKTTNFLFNLKFGSDLKKAFNQIEKRNSDKKVLILPTFKNMSINTIIAH